VSATARIATVAGVLALATLASAADPVADLGASVGRVGQVEAVGPYRVSPCLAVPSLAVRARPRCS
jgi:hypothetical protein